MEWWLAILLIFGALIVVMLSGMPIAFCFMLVNAIAMFVVFGGAIALDGLITSIYSSLATFTIMPVALFVLMGELMSESGIGWRTIDSLDKWFGRMPGRLALLTVAAGALLASMTGSSTAETAILGGVLTPEMEKRGYKKSMSLGPVLGSGGLAIMIPPSSLAIIVGAIGEIPIDEILIAIIFPGVLMAAFYGVYIITRCYLQPSIAPVYDAPPVPLSDKLLTTVRYVLPIGLVIFLVIGVIFLGVATASEAAATGTLGIVILALLYGRLNWKVVKRSVVETLKVTGMVFLIIAGAVAFSQILAYTGAVRGMTEFATGLSATPLVIVIGMQVVVLILGCFMSLVSIIMITLPIFVPVVAALGFDTVWFATIFLLALEMGVTTPPVGMNLFVMKGIAPPDTTMRDIILAAVPFLYCDALVMILIIAFPAIALWLPSLIK